MADLICRVEMHKLLVLDETRYSGVFGVTDYESEYKIMNFEMAGFNMADQNAKSYLLSMVLGS